MSQKVLWSVWWISLHQSCFEIPVKLCRRFFLLDESTAAARIVLKFMIPQMIGVPAIICGQIPVYSL